MDSFNIKFNNETLEIKSIYIYQKQFECSVYYYDRLLITYATFYDSEECVVERIKTYFEHFKSFDELINKINIDNRLPLKIKKSIILSANKKIANELVSMLLINYDRNIERVINLLDEAHKILNIDFDMLMNKIDYRYKDQRLGRINNAFSELRAVIALNKIGFNNITLCSGDNITKKADIVAVSENSKYVIDVLNFSNSHLERPDLKFTSEIGFINYFESKYKDKKEQLEISKVEQNSNKIGLFAVIDEVNWLNSLNDYNEINIFLNNIWVKISFHEECELFILMRGEIYHLKN